MKSLSKKSIILSIVFVSAVIVSIGLAHLLVNINTRKQEALQYPLKLVDIAEGEIDPKIWGKNFPYHYDSFIKTQEDYGKTSYGGSTPYDKLKAYPAMKRLWAGYAFSIDHNEERGHHYAQIDQQNTQRVKVANQPGACINCHAAETPKLIKELGWEKFNKTPYNELKDALHYGSSCSDCHDAKTMQLTITRPAFKNALKEQGIDLTKATHQQMRSFICAQCHVEYYFKGTNKVLTFPWSKGLSVENVESYYDTYGFKDWVHEETGAEMIKIQHPEYELWSTGIHARSGVSCADCHMPYIRKGSIKISDHWLRSPLNNIQQSCQTCHKQSEKELSERIVHIQDKTAKVLRLSEEALVDAIDAIVDMKNKGATDEDLLEVRKMHRSAQLRWDFISSENSTGFHSPLESIRILAESINFARKAETKAKTFSNKNK